MVTLNIDLTKTAGSIKPMNAVNNGPIGGKTRNNGNFQLYKEAEIPYARNHDAAFCADYGSEFSVDIHNIFAISTPMKMTPLHIYLPPQMNISKQPPMPERKLFIDWVLKLNMILNSEHIRQRISQNGQGFANILSAITTKAGQVDFITT